MGSRNSTTPYPHRMVIGFLKATSIFPLITVHSFSPQVPAFALILGDNDGDGILEGNGDTIRVPEAGLYYIKVDLNDNTYVLEKREWGILGDATQQDGIKTSTHLG